MTATRLPIAPTRWVRMVGPLAALLLAAPTAAPLAMATPMLTTAPTATAVPAPPAPAAPLTNLAHLDFLADTVSPPRLSEHTTYRLAEEPALGVLWTYADRRDSGAYERVGGGEYDPATNTWAQGAYNADDLTRAAVVYLRHWRQTGTDASRARAYQLLRAVTYLQTATGPDAGNVVLWMQPDGSLNPSPEPVELPDPSDSAESYWLARTVWALGEGYAAFGRADPSFAGFLRGRLSLALAALERQSLSRYGRWQVSDGTRVPAWLVVDGADASAEAVLGLAAFVTAGEGPGGDDSLVGRATRALRQLAEGIAAMSGGDATTWPYGAILPWTHSISQWHAWGGQAPAALAVAAGALDRPSLLPAAVRDGAVFSPHLLTSTGPVNGWLPVPADRTQIAYGVDSRVQSLLATADATGRDGLRELAGIAASWYFGANPAGEPMYDPVTGRTYDGIDGNGVVNRNSGAESTMHGLLSMLALDARPGVAADARAGTALVSVDGVQVVEAESARLAGSARVVTPPEAWTGESLWSGDAYLELPSGAEATWSVPARTGPSRVTPVVDLVPDPGSAVVAWWSDRGWLGRVDSGSGARQGVSQAPGALLPVTLRDLLPAGATQVTATVPAQARVGARVDALLLAPVVSQLRLDGPRGGRALLHNTGKRDHVVPVDLPGRGQAVVRSYDRTGQLRAPATVRGTTVRARVLAGGFTVVSR